MHEGCSGSFANGKQMADKIRMMGFSSMSMPSPLEIKCVNCDESFEMFTMESICTSCNMVYAVTPCSADNAKNVMPAGINY